MFDERYTLKKNEDGFWCVVDIQTDIPATARDRLLICMTQDEARDAAALMNMVEHMRRRRDAPVLARDEARRFLEPIGWTR